jgi:trans-aconitate methyltransferase
MIQIETVENRWGILYSRYPEVYQRFAEIQSRRESLEFILSIQKLDRKTVADIGCGTGLSTFDLAKPAARVFGIGPEDAMRLVAEKKASALGIENVCFLRRITYAQM